MMTSTGIRDGHIGLRAGMRRGLVVCGALALAVAGLAPAGARPPAESDLADPRGADVEHELLCAAPGVSDRCERWSFLRDTGFGQAVVVHPDGHLVYAAAGALHPDTGGYHFLVTAFDPAGAVAWSAWFASPAGDEEWPEDLVVSADGARLCVTGWMQTGPGGWPGGLIPAGYAVGVACYDAETGDVLWEHITETPAGRWRGASALATATVPFEVGGETVPRDVVFVTGTDEAAPLRGPVDDKDFLTMAFDAEHGELLWTSTYNGPGDGWDRAWLIDVSEDGRTLFVSGASVGDGGTGMTAGYGVVAYDTATGTQLWETRYDSRPFRDDVPFALGLSPDGGLLVVSGRSQGGDHYGSDYATVAFATDDGSQQWAQRYDGPRGPDEVPGSVFMWPWTVYVKGEHDVANDLAFDPLGERVYVTGTAGDFPAGPAYTTVAYDLATGDEVWVAKYNGPSRRWDEAHAIAVAPSGERIYVTGRSSRARLMSCPGCAEVGGQVFDDIATVAYDRDGNQQWVARFSHSQNTDVGTAIAVAPSGDAVYVTGLSLRQDALGFAGADLVVLAYDG